MFRRLFGKRENVFVKLIREQASLTLEGMEALKTFLATGDPQASALLNTKEKAADEARRILIDELNKTFVTRSTARISSRSPAPSMTCWTTATVPSAKWRSSRSSPPPICSGCPRCCATRPMRSSWLWSACRTIPVLPTTTHSAPRRWRTGWKTCIASRCGPIQRR